MKLNIVGGNLGIKLIKASLIPTIGLLLTATFAGAQPSATEMAENRCGWFSNPTPANASLFDRDGEWIVGVQGGHQADGDWPAFGPKEWVKTNGNYGYGCACMRVRVDRESKEVLAIESARAKPLSACRKDPAIRRFGFK